MQIEARNMHTFQGRSDNLLGICDVRLGEHGEFAIKGVRILDSEKGAFVSMPQYKDKDGKYQDIAHPTTKEGREQLNQAVLAEYEHVEQQMRQQAAGAER